MNIEKNVYSGKIDVEDFAPSPEEKISPPQKPWYSRCPICRESSLIKEENKKFFGLVKIVKFKCPVCSAVFQLTGSRLKLIKIQKDPYNIKDRFKIGTILSDKEWHRIAYGGLSNKEIAQKVQERKAKQKAQDMQAIKNKIANGEISLVLIDPPMFLKKNEEILLSIPGIELKEEKTVRVRGAYTGVSMKVMKGVYLRTGRFGGETKQEIKTIDIGTFVITNKRLSFLGSKKTVSAPLNKVVGIEAYEDGFILYRSNKQKPEIFVGFDSIEITATIGERSYNLAISGEFIKIIIEKQISEID